MWTATSIAPLTLARCPGHLAPSPSSDDRKAVNYVWPGIATATTHLIVVTYSTLKTIPQSLRPHRPVKSLPDTRKQCSQRSRLRCRPSTNVNRTLMSWRHHEQCPVNPPDSTRNRMTPTNKTLSTPPLQNFKQLLKSLRIHQMLMSLSATLTTLQLWVRSSRARRHAALIARLWAGVAHQLHPPAKVTRTAVLSF